MYRMGSKGRGQGDGLRTMTSVPVPLAGAVPAAVAGTTDWNVDAASIASCSISLGLQTSAPVAAAESPTRSRLLPLRGA